MLPDTFKRWSVLKPFAFDAMNVAEGLVALNGLFRTRVIDSIDAWLDKSIKHDDTVLVDHRNFARDITSKALRAEIRPLLVHLTVDC